MVPLKNKFSFFTYLKSHFSLFKVLLSFHSSADVDCERGRAGPAGEGLPGAGGGAGEAGRQRQPSLHHSGRNECPDRRMEVKLAILGNNDRPTNQPTNQSTDRRRT